MSKRFQSIIFCVKFLSGSVFDRVISWKRDIQVTMSRNADLSSIGFSFKVVVGAQQELLGIVEYKTRAGLWIHIRLISLLANYHKMNILQ